MKIPQRLVTEAMEKEKGENLCTEIMSRKENRGTKRMMTKKER